MELVDVYRVESPKGYGPYRCLCDSGPLYNHDTHPDPDSDGLHDMDDIHFFGFRSLRRLQDWFGVAAPIDRDALRHRQYIVARYQVPASFVRDSASGKQLIFDKAKATLVERLPLELAWGSTTGETNHV